MSAPSTVRRVTDQPIARVLAALLVGILVAGALALAPAVGAASVQDDGAANESANDSATETNATELRPIDVANATGNDTEPIELSGEGQTVSDQFELDDGLVVAEYDHDGESNVQVDLWNDDTDEQAAFLVNEIGVVNGTTAAPVTAGNYSLNVNADGAWSVTLVQPNTTATIAAQAGNGTDGNASTANGSDANETDGDGAVGNETDGSSATSGPSSANETNATTIASAPATASGEGPTVLGPVDFEESVIVTGNHTGESNFVVELWRENATSLFDGWTLVYNEIGQVEAAETRADHQGISWVVVTADGEWDLRFEER